MGCDIHLYTERLRTVNDKEAWFNCDNWRLNPYYFEYPEEESQWEISPIYRSRNYNLFAMLANVRNSNDNNYICEPRGLPNDVSKIVKDESDNWGCDGHSHSWFTLAELIQFQQNNPIQKFAGMMTPENAALVDAGKMPESWCKWTNQESYVSREWEHENETMGYLIDPLIAHMKDIFWIYGDDYDVSVHAKFRIVFWFDN